MPFCGKWPNLFEVLRTFCKCEQVIKPLIHVVGEVFDCINENKVFRVIIKRVVVVVMHVVAVWDFIDVVVVFPDFPVQVVNPALFVANARGVVAPVGVLI